MRVWVRLKDAEFAGELGEDVGPAMRDAAAQLSLRLIDKGLVPVGRTFSAAAKAGLSMPVTIGPLVRLQPPAKGASVGGA